MTQVPALRLVFLTCHLSHFCFSGPEWESAFESLYVFALLRSLLSDELVIKMLNWYLVQLKPNGHRLAKTNLEKQGFNMFLPLQNVTKRSAHKFVDRLVPLFPGYMFVELDTTQNAWRKVNSTLGVARIVSLGGTPTPIPSEIVNEFISRCDGDGVLCPTQVLEFGQDVQVLRGPFANFVAQVEEISPDQRVWILIDLLGQSSRISVTKDAIALAS